MASYSGGQIFTLYLPVPSPQQRKYAASITETNLFGQKSHEYGAFILDSLQFSEKDKKLTLPLDGSFLKVYLQSQKNPDATEYKAFTPADNLFAQSFYEGSAFITDGPEFSSKDLAASVLYDGVFMHPFLTAKNALTAREEAALHIDTPLFAQTAHENLSFIVDVDYFAEKDSRNTVPLQGAFCRPFLEEQKHTTPGEVTAFCIETPLFAEKSREHLSFVVDERYFAEKDLRNTTPLQAAICKPFLEEHKQPTPGEVIALYVQPLLFAEKSRERISFIVDEVYFMEKDKIHTIPYQGEMLHPFYEIKPEDRPIPQIKRSYAFII